MIIYVTEEQVAKLKVAGVLLQRSYYASKWCGRVPHFRCDVSTTLAKLKEVLHPHPVKTTVRGKSHWCFTIGQKSDAVPKGHRLLALEYEGHEGRKKKRTGGTGVQNVVVNEIKMQVRSRSVEGSGRPSFHYSNFRIHPTTDEHLQSAFPAVSTWADGMIKDICGGIIPPGYVKLAYREITAETGGLVLVLVQQRRPGEELVVKAFLLGKRSETSSRHFERSVVCGVGAPKGSGALLQQALHHYLQQKGYRSVSLYAADRKYDDALQRYYNRGFGYDLTGKQDEFDLPEMRRAIAATNDVASKRSRHIRYDDDDDDPDSRRRRH